MVIIRLTRKEAEKLPVSARVPRKRDIIIEGLELSGRWYGPRNDSRESLTSSMRPDMGGNWHNIWGWGRFCGNSYAHLVKKGSREEMVVGQVL